MADVDNRYGEGGMQPVEERQDFIATCPIERRNRFIHEHDPRGSQQRPRDRDTLCLTTGQRVDPAVQQVTETQKFYGLVETDILAAAAALTVLDVLPHV